MAHKTLLTICALDFCLEKVFGYYCDSDRCHEEDEYCCGDNICCSSYKVWELWYFWFGLGFFMMMVSTCGCLWRYKYSRPIFVFGGSPMYSPLKNAVIELPGDPEYTDYNPSSASVPTPYYSPQSKAAPPPPYTQTQGGNNGFTDPKRH